MKHNGGTATHIGFFHHGSRKKQAYATPCKSTSSSSSDISKFSSAVSASASAAAVIGWPVAQSAALNCASTSATADARRARRHAVFKVRGEAPERLVAVAGGLGGAKGSCCEFVVVAAGKKGVRSWAEESDARLAVSPSTCSQQRKFL